jgi:hypothetical protein
MSTQLRTKSGETVLHYVIRAKNVSAQRKFELIRYLVEEAGQSISASNNVRVSGAPLC